MGMKILRKREVPEGKYTLAFVGYDDEASQAVVELTYNWDQAKPYEIGTGFGHLAVGVPNVKGGLRSGHQGRRQDHPRAGPGEVRHDGDRLRRGSGRLQDRTDRAEVAAG